MELKPEFSGSRGVMGAGGEDELLLPLTVLLLFNPLVVPDPVLPFTVFAVFPLEPFGVLVFPPECSTDRRWVRNFSSRRHLARLFENQT